MLTGLANRRIKILVADEPADWVRRFDNLFLFKPVDFIVTGRDLGRLEIITEVHPDLAMIAGDIPGFDGLEMVRRLHRLSAQLPIIMLGGRYSRHWLERALQARVKSVIPRPVDVSQLVEMTKKCLGVN